MGHLSAVHTKAPELTFKLQGKVQDVSLRILNTKEGI